MRKNSVKRDGKRQSHEAESFNAKFSDLEKRFFDTKDATQLDLAYDLDEEFFTTSFEMIHALTSINNFVAGKMKYYVDLVARMHARYVELLQNSDMVNEKVRTAEQKLRLAVETTSTSNDVIEKLKDALAEAWRITDATEERQALLGTHRDDISINETGSNYIETHKTINEHDLRLRSYVFRERDRLAQELQDYKKRLSTHRYYTESVEKMTETLRETVSKQQLYIKKLVRDNYMLEEKCTAENAEHEEAINALQKKLLQLQEINQELQKYEKRFKQSTFEIRDLSHIIDRHVLSNRNLQQSISHKLEETRCLKTNIHNLESENKSLKRLKDELEAQNRNNTRDMKKSNELHTMLSRRFHQLSKKYADLTAHELTIKNEMMFFKKKLEGTNAKLDEVTRQRDEINNTRERLRGEVSHLYDVIASLRHDLVIQKGQMHDVQRDLEIAHNDSNEKATQIQKLNKQNRDFQLEANDLSKKIENLDEILLERSNQISDLQESLQAKQKSNLQLKKQLEYLHSEKMILQKNNAICAQDRQNMHTLKAKLSVQIEQLSNQVAGHEQDAAILKNQIEQLNNLVKRKQTEIHNMERQLKRVRTDLYEMRIRNGQLQHTIDDDEKRFKLMACNLEEVTKEKSLVGQQMMRRNGELRAQHEKLSMMQLALNNGTMQYNQRIEDIRLLKTEITNLNMTNDCLSRAVAVQANVRQEVVRLERQLLRERLCVSVFTEEMKHPYRIHRWRVLRGKDPSQYELIRKNQVLLKRNIRLGVDLVNMENKVKDIQRLYDILKQQVKHMPDPSVETMLWQQRRINQRQNQKMRAMKAELAINDIDLQSRDVIIQQFQFAIKNQCKISQTIEQSPRSDNEKLVKQLYCMTSED